MVKRSSISTLSNTCFHIIKYTFPHHHTHITVCHFVGVYVYAGAINRTPTAANGLPKCCWRIAITLRTPTKYTQNTPQNTNKHSVKYQRSPTKWGANIPPGVGDRFIVPVSLHYQICIFTSSNMCFRFNAHAFPHYQLRVFTSLNMCIHFITRTYTFAILWVFSYMRAR